MKVFGYDINFSRVQNAISTPTEDRPKAADAKGKILSEQVLYRTKQDIATWRAALNQAESILNPDRTELLRIYKDVVLDAHVSACIETRKNAILGALFNVVKNGKVKEDKSAQLRTKWFRDATSYFLDSIFYGFSLVQFGDLVDGQFTDVSLVPRHYVKPEFGIVVSSPAQTTGASFLEAPYKDWTIGVGDKYSLGILNEITPLVLWKKGALGAWSSFSDSFGTPYRIGKTDSRDEKTRSEMANALKNLANSSYAVIDNSDLIEILEVKNSDVYLVFDQMIQRCNSEISKRILGQTSTSEEKNYKGASEVHERILHSINDADEILIENVFNYQLVPFLNTHGFKLEGCTLSIEPDDRLSIEQKSKIDLELLKFYKIPADYILKTYGTPVEEITTPQVDQAQVDAMRNKLKNYYGA